MKSFRATLVPRSAFGTPLKGDTFFGQLCWAARNRYGEERLASLLEGYTEGRPFAVVSDAFPTEHLPRPTLPGHWFDDVPNVDRKTLKKRLWMPLDRLTVPLADWLAHCKTADDLADAGLQERPQPHNTINRATGTTGEGPFAPYAIEQLWHGRKIKATREIFVPAKLDMYFVVDETRLTGDELRTLIADIGTLGFGRDASIGLGKFEVGAFGPIELPVQSGADAWLTFAPCAPQGIKWDASHCFYQIFARFGRHGDLGVQTGKPFKTPVLLAETGAVLTPHTYRAAAFTGQGLGGGGRLSKAIPETVHQGYAPVIGVRLPGR